MDSVVSLNRSIVLHKDIYVVGEELPDFAMRPVLWEKSFNDREAHAWLMENWSMSVWVGVAYVLGIGLLLPRWMRERKPLDLSWGLFVWNVALATFSITGMVRILPEFAWVLRRENGYHRSICDHNTFRSLVGGYWTWLFALSKNVELGDTVFLVIRKRRLSFLHVYHHFSVLILTWYLGSLSVVPPTVRWYVTINVTVHAFMYTYFAIQSLRRFKMPKWVAMTITTMQTVQMVAAVWINVYAYRVKRRGEACAVSDDALKVTTAIYFSYFLLFTWFFYESYLRKVDGSTRKSKIL